MKLGGGGTGISVINYFAPSVSETVNINLNSDPETSTPGALRREKPVRNHEKPSRMHHAA